MWPITLILPFLCPAEVRFGDDVIQRQLASLADALFISASSSLILRSRFESWCIAFAVSLIAVSSPVSRRCGDKLFGDTIYIPTSTMH